MPADRFLHPRLGHSTKVCGLTDLQFRVWVQYQLSADDFGVMRMSAITVQADNDALAEKPAAAIQRCLEALEAAGLVVSFEHQGRRYLCQLDWQHWQRVEYPRPTIHPRPPEGILSACCDRTKTLISLHPGGKRRDGRQTFADDLTKIRQPVDDLARARPREEATATATATGLRLPATAAGLTVTSVRLQRGSASDRLERGSHDAGFEEFWANYPRKEGKAAAKREWIRLNPNEDVRAKIRTALTWQRRLPDWLKDRGRFIPQPRTYLHQHRWEDEPIQIPIVNERTIQSEQAVNQAVAFMNRKPS